MPGVAMFHCFPYITTRAITTRTIASQWRGSPVVTARVPAYYGAGAPGCRSTSKIFDVSLLPLRDTFPGSGHDGLVEPVRR